MGTKNNPGQFDCFAAAAPDEPMFILLGKDPEAGLLVRLWALLRHGRHYNKPEKIAEALKSADAMDAYCKEMGRTPSEAVGLLEAATGGMGEHPDGYEHPCMCDECQSYG